MRVRCACTDTSRTPLHRHNVIIWCRSSQFRQSDAYRARFVAETITEYAPDQRCLSRTHDRDYHDWMHHFRQHEH